MVTVRGQEKIWSIRRIAPGASGPERSFGGVIDCGSRDDASHRAIDAFGTGSWARFVSQNDC
jgi:hypothetical protein